MKIWLLIIAAILIGITFEVLFTSITNFFKKRDLKLEGKSYLWMFPIYAVVPFIYILVLNCFSIESIFTRGLVYMLLFYVLEFISGTTIKLLIKKSPWDYSKHKIKIFGREYLGHIWGVVSIKFIPIWYIYGILGELTYNFLIAI